MAEVNGAALISFRRRAGMAPRYNPETRVIQIELAQEEIGNNLPATVGLTGDLKAILAQMVAQLEETPWECDDRGAWKTGLVAEVAKKKAELKPALESDEVPMGYFRPLQEIQKVLPRDAIIVSEGASTMDISRSVLENYQPRNRLDAGSWGTMGGGIVSGVANLPKDGPPPVNVFQPGARYEKIMEAFGGKGFYYETPDQLAKALRTAFDSGETALINVAIAPTAKKARQIYSHWLSR